MAWEWLEKYLRGKAPISTEMVQPGTGGIMESGVQQSGTQGLFGTGGEYGTGGLLTTFNQPSNPGKGMLDLFSNLPAVTGLEMIQGGMTGKPIEQTLLPAFKSGLRTTTAVESVKAAKRKRDYIKKYKDQVPEKDMKLFMAFPVKYITGMISKKFAKDTASLNPEIKRLYYESIAADEAGNFSTWLADLSEGERALFKTKIQGKKTNVQEFLMNLPDTKKNKTKTYSKDQERKIKMTMEANQNITRDQAIQALEEANQL